jgi:hypothetical protein
VGPALGEDPPLHLRHRGRRSIPSRC